TMLFVLATLATVFVGSIAVPPPQVGPPGSERAELTVNIVRDGYVVAAPGGYLQPGCTRVGAAVVAVPLRLGLYDARALIECLARAKANPVWAELATQPGIRIAGAGEVPFAVLV